MAKYSYEQKLHAVLSVLEKGISTRAAAKILSANRGDISKWIRMYQEHGAEGLQMKAYAYTGDFKIDVVECMHKNYLSINEAAAKFGIPSPSTVGKWQRIYYEEGLEALHRNNRNSKPVSNIETPKTLELDKSDEEDLITENQRLRMENAYLKKLNALVQKRVQQESGKK